MPARSFPLPLPPATAALNTLSLLLGSRIEGIAASQKTSPKTSDGSNGSSCQYTDSSYRSGCSLFAIEDIFFKKPLCSLTYIGDPQHLGWLEPRLRAEHMASRSVDQLAAAQRPANQANGAESRQHGALLRCRAGAGGGGLGPYLGRPT